MSSCLAIVSDMIFASRITGTAAKLGTPCQVVGDLPSLEAALSESEPKTVFVDMNLDGLSAGDAIRTVKALRPGARVIAFFSHVQTELMEQARSAGADDVWPRSLFVQKLQQVLEDAGQPGPQ